MNQLIAIIGPSCSGKTTLIDRIKAGNCPNLCDQLGIGSVSDWQFLHKSEWENPKIKELDRVVVHKACGFREHDPTFYRLLRLLEKADRSVVVTLCVPQTVLAKRAKDRLKGDLKGTSSFGYKIDRLIRGATRIWRYEMSKSLIAGYECWFSLLKSNSIRRSYLIDGTVWEVDEAIEYSKKALYRLMN